MQALYIARRSDFCSPTASTYTAVSSPPQGRKGETGDRRNRTGTDRHRRVKILEMLVKAITDSNELLRSDGNSIDKLVLLVVFMGSALASYDFNRGVALMGGMVFQHQGGLLGTAQPHDARVLIGRDWRRDDFQPPSGASFLLANLPPTHPESFSRRYSPT